MSTPTKEQCEARHAEIDKRLARGDKMLSELHTAVCGPGDGTEPGMAERIRRLEQDSARRRSREMWIGGVLATVLAAFLIGLGSLAVRGVARMLHQ